MTIRIRFLIALMALVSGCATNNGSLRAIESNATPMEFQRTVLSNTHPLAGNWRFDATKTMFKPPAGYDGECIEEYVVRADGTKSSRSGEERNESEFMITPVSRAPYWYKWVDKITANNGKPDCGGAYTSVAHIAVNFIYLHPSGQSFAICESDEMNSCYAELFRQVQ